MKFLVGYQLRPDERFNDLIVSNADQISEVYFSWPDLPSGRNPAALHREIPSWEALERQKEALQRFHQAGIGLNLLLNGNCYGSGSLSRSLFQRIGDLIDWLTDQYSCSGVTVASPVIAHFIKENFPDIEVRASVNMGVDSREAVDYLGSLFDGFYLKREYNRSIRAFSALAEHCRRSGKKVYMLANSGCLNNCPARAYHDNLVAHENEIVKMDNAFSFHGLCRDFLSVPGNRERILECSNWVRPEDLYLFEGMVDGVKLATRVHKAPEQIVSAYLRGSFSGNLLTLTEPDLSALFYPYALNSRAFPDNFIRTVSECDKCCDKCGYCRDVFREALEKLPGIPELSDTVSAK